MRTCPDCHSLVDDGAVFCDNCGFKLPPVEREIEPTIKAEIAPPSKLASQPEAIEEQAGACSSCGYLNMPGEMFCQNCGVQLAPVASVPPAPPVPMVPSQPPEEVEPAQVEPPEPTSSGAFLAAKQVSSPSECPNCGFQNEVGEKYCQNCGQLLETEVEPQPSTPEDIVPIDQEATPGPSPLIDVEEPAADQQVELISETSEEQIKAESVPASYVSEEPVAAMPAVSEPEPVSIAEPEEAAVLLPTAQEADQSPASGIRGRLVVRTTGVEIPLPSGQDEITIGRVDLVRNIFPDIDMAGYGGESSGVSRMHARLVLQGDQLYIEDLNSTNYTFVNKLRLQPGQPYLVSDGDEIRLGLLAMVFHSK